ncbi:MAG: hypothetical protein QF819_04670 [Gemmatimonadota bacterium]|jgi:hypothetical protein|nr:hypothetical protein [Gemmatimonadota bacterium]MDP6528704.1 hypothetical protein [Gemmatimonadota bacterium]MDP6802452.1 hypothetical protein [Gemmatimonadota bacterium]MDP7030992.1 hypothetical protein [Gemmatimonadota bacterium]
MPLMGKAFIFVLVAGLTLPLGPGGICCCLLADDCPDAAPKAAPVESCCSSGAGPDASASSAPAERDCCACPELQPAPSSSATLAVVAAAGSPLAAPESQVRLATPAQGTEGFREETHPPPVLGAVYRTTCSLLC